MVELDDFSYLSNINDSVILILFHTLGGAVHVGLLLLFAAFVVCSSI